MYDIYISIISLKVRVCELIIFVQMPINYTYEMR